MKNIVLTGFLCLCAIAAAQSVHFDYDRSTNFAAFKTYQWVSSPSRSVDPLMDQNIKRAVDTQLAIKGLQRVESGADLQIAYLAALGKEKQFDGWGMGPRGFGPGRVTTSTIDIGKLVVNISAASTKQLIWRGDAEKTLDVKKDPDKNYRNLEKAVAKLFKNYPPPSAR